MILEFARSQSFATGSNREGSAAPPGLLFLLPTLEELRPCALGEPGADVVRGLGSWEEVRRLGAAEPPPDGCRLLLVGRNLPGGASAARIGAVPRDLPVWIDADPGDVVLHALGAGVPRWLLPEGAGRRPEAAPGSRVAFRIPSARAARSTGERWRRVTSRVMRRFGVGRAAVAGAVAYARPLVPGGPPREETPSGGTLVLPAGSAPGPPAWLVRAALAAGHDVSGAPWRILPARGYRSQKILFLVGDGEERMAVKITQDPAFNGRLLNEHRALVALDGSAGLPSGSVPQPRFESRHRDLAVVAETALDGVPFPTRSAGTPDCPVAARAMEWLALLATSTARPATGADHADALGGIVGRLRETYRLDRATGRAVDEALAKLAKAPRVPAVFLHGDPGEWNLLVGADDGISFLDWENAEPEGPPLWDLISFLTGYTRFALEREGTRPTPSALIGRLLAPSPFADRLVDRALDLAHRLHLSREALEPLLILFFVSAAVREAWRLPPDNPDRGHGIRWLREAAARRETSPVLARLRSGA